MAAPRLPLGLALLALLTLGLCAPALRNGFAMDDRLVAMPEADGGRTNRMVSEVRPLGDYFATGYYHGLDRRSELYRPVTILSYALVNALQRSTDPEAKALPQHAVNVLLHVLATLLVVALVSALGCGAGPALLAGLVFGVHAIHSEVVAGVVGRAELLAFTAGAAAALLLLRAVRAASKLGVVSGVLGSGLLLLVALCSKESAVGWVLLTPLLLLARRWATGDARPLPLPPVALALLPPLGMFLVLRQGMLASLEGPVEPIEFLANPLAHADAGPRILTAVMLWGRGLAQTVLPWTLQADYGPCTIDLVSSPLDARFLLAAAALAWVALGALRLARREPLLLLAAVAFVALSALTANVVRPIGTIFGERLYYAPSLALSFAVAWLAQRGWLAGRGRVPLVAWCAWCAALLLAHHGKWRDDAALFLHEARASPRNVRMQVCAAGVLQERGDASGAQRLLEQATAVDPDYALAWNNLGVAYLNQARWDDAARALARCSAAKRALPSDSAAMLPGNLALLRRKRAEAEAQSSPPR